jgi:glutamate synthase (ferredoxin)
VGYGASAVVPYGAFDAVINWHGQKRIQNGMIRGDQPMISVDKAMYNFRKAIDKGLLKIMSKMGISLLTSYHGAQVGLFLHTYICMYIVWSTYLFNCTNNC